VIIKTTSSAKEHMMKTETVCGILVGVHFGLFLSAR
jgi:F0F1-type ATP synthase assembly protein I